MAEKDSTSEYMDIEEVTELVKQAEAVATLIHCDDAFDGTVGKFASGAVTTCWRAALNILTAKEPKVAA